MARVLRMNHCNLEANGSLCCQEWERVDETCFSHKLLAPICSSLQGILCERKLLLFSSFQDQGQVMEHHLPVIVVSHDYWVCKTCSPHHLSLTTSLSDIRMHAMSPNEIER